MTGQKVEPQNLIYVRYLDHLLFRNSDSRLYNPVVREAVGWLIKENEQAVWILWDRSVKKLPCEEVQIKESGLVILKNTILEVKRLLSKEICRGNRQTSNCRVCAPEEEAKNSTKVESKKGKTMQPSQEDISEPKAQLKIMLSRRRKLEKEDI